MAEHPEPRETRFDGRTWDTLGERGSLLAGEGWRYTRRGWARHKIGSNWDSLCGLDLAEDEWHGTGTQDEYERLASLPKCTRCMRSGAL